jgi:hypothetical protein
MGVFHFMVRNATGNRALLAMLTLATKRTSRFGSDAVPGGVPSSSVVSKYASARARSLSVGRGA